jgi:hypothetical protein
MPASEARVRANQANALKSTGPTTVEGKERSRANSYKHGLTGAGTVLPQREAAEIERRVGAFEDELQPSGDVGLALVRRAATLSVRMERCVMHENAGLTDRVRQALADFVPPEGVDEAETARLREEVATRAMFDPSKEATLARKYEAAAERGFFRALKELRLVEKAAKAADAEFEAELSGESLGSFLPMEQLGEEFHALYPDDAFPNPRKSSDPVGSGPLPTFAGRFDVPFSIGRPR